MTTNPAASSRAPATGSSSGRAFQCNYCGETTNSLGHTIEVRPRTGPWTVEDGIRLAWCDPCTEKLTGLVRQAPKGPKTPRQVAPPRAWLPPMDTNAQGQLMAQTTRQRGRRSQDQLPAIGGLGAVRS